MRRCYRCGETKDFSHFRGDCTQKSGYGSRCKTCDNQHTKERRNRKKIIDPIFKLKQKLRGVISQSFIRRGYKKNSKTEEILGCDIVTFRYYFENLFVENMSWENAGEWHIDHIIPLSSAKTIEDVYKLCHYTNLQPLWGIDNIKKGDKIL
jgi:hypothetical protein